jgi:signal transduction histidine kinase
MNPFTRFVRARLQRRIFAYFGVTILLTFLGTLGAYRASFGTEASGPREFERARTFVGGRFERVWDDAEARNELASALRNNLDASVVIQRPDGLILSMFGSSCENMPSVRSPVMRQGTTLGFVTLCAERYRPQSSRILVPLGVLVIALWAMAGMLAWRLAWPLGELARVAKDLGEGRFSSRACLGPHSHGEADIIGRAINDMAARVERQLSEQRELLAAVSHELRTPLSRVRLLTEMGRDRGGDAKMLDDLDREVIEMDALVGDLLASSRMDFAATDRRRVDLVEAAGRAVERAGVDPTVLVNDAGDAKVSGDATLLARALANLIDNAKKHGGGLETLRLRRVRGERGTSIAIDAEDAGAGFEDGESKRVFEPFYRRGQNGTLGLGLALVKRIAEAHGGRAYAENRAEGGARVGIELPIEEAQVG